MIERSVQPAFAELGIWFQSRPYAMGGTSSGPEVALCEDSIFGLDIDVLSWDFGMTDNTHVGNMEMYFRQAGLHPNRPACVGLEIHGGSYDSRLKILRNLEDSGLTALYMPPQIMTAVVERIPDSMGLNSSDLLSMPPFLRSFKCEGVLEKGSPGCSAGKWTDVKSVCEAVKFRTGWHPGWYVFTRAILLHASWVRLSCFSYLHVFRKWHALLGNMISMALLELLDEALADMEKLDVSDPEMFYFDLKAQEDMDYDMFLQSNLTSSHGEMIRHKKEENQNFDIPFLFKHRAYCHTALLPAESRYLGILTETSRIGFFHYDKGVSRKKVESQPSNNSELSLVFEPRERQDCSLLLQVDYKDYFFLSEPEGTKKLTLPNMAELALYERPKMGLVGFSLAGCEWGKCDKAEARESGLELEEWEMHINGVQVTNFTTIEKSVSFVRHKDGQYFSPNEGGQYEIQVRVKAVGKFLRFSSFMIF